MSSLFNRVLASTLLFSAALVCSLALPAQQAAPTIRIANRIDENSLVTLKGNTNPRANASNDRGRVSADLPMTDLILVLSRSQEQQAAFEKFVANQYDPASPDFHHWLKPEEVGQNFGPSETDIATISQWLNGHGFSVDEVTNDRMSIRFSGTAAQVESAFHTEIHTLEVKGVEHIGNMTDPKIPSALSPAVVGVKALHNFFPHPLFRMGNTVQRDSATGKWKQATTTTSTEAKTLAGGGSTSVHPEFGISVSSGSSSYLIEDVSPYDFATIYNVLPLWTAGTDGTGQTIAIAATSSIVPADVTNFRSTFGLPAYTTGQLTMISGNSQPVTVCTSTSSTALCNINDQVENALDAEWAGAVAKGANIVVVSSYPASKSDDTLYDSESYIVNHVTANIMNVSYGECELGNGTAGNVQYYNLWQTAATEGIAVFVATGDSGAPACDQNGDSNGTPYAAEYGLSVNGLASTPYNTAVGGTDFNWCSLTSTTACTAAPYWNSTNASNGSSAKGYVPEIPWNDTCASPIAVDFINAWAEKLGYSSVTTAEAACNFVVVHEAYIYNTYNVDLSGLVDTIGGGGGASGCVANDNSNTTSCGTATTTGTAYGNLPLYNDGWPKPSWQTGVTGIPTDGVRDIPDISFFAAAGYLSSSAYLMCVSQNSSTGQCTYSATKESTAQEVGGTSVATPAMAGVMALINQRAGSPQGNPNAELYKLAAKQTYSGCSAESATTGNGCYFNDIDTGNIATPCDNGYLGYTSPDCTVNDTADKGRLGILNGYNAGTAYDLATGLGSLNVANVVNSFSATSSHFALVSVTPASYSITASQALSVTVAVTSAYPGGATPTGTVTLSSGSYNSGAQTLSTSGTCTAASCNITIPANSLGSGTDNLTASYSGDTTYAPEIGGVTVTVAGASFTLSASAASPASISAAGSAISTITVTSTNGYTGTVALSCAASSTNPTNTTANTPTCTGSNASSVAMGGTATFTVSNIVATTTTTSALDNPKLPGKGWAGAGGGAVLALLFFLGIPARRRKWLTMLGVLVVMVVMGSMAACGGGGTTKTTTTVQGTTAGTYTFTITGSGTPSVTPKPTATFTVTVAN
jgi:subtilase family serine protease